MATATEPRPFPGLSQASHLSAGVRALAALRGPPISPTVTVVKRGSDSGRNGHSTSSLSCGAKRSDVEVSIEAAWALAFSTTGANSCPLCSLSSHCAPEYAPTALSPPKHHHPSLHSSAEPPSASGHTSGAYSRVRPGDAEVHPRAVETISTTALCRLEPRGPRAADSLGYRRARSNHWRG